MLEVPTWFNAGTAVMLQTVPEPPATVTLANGKSAKLDEATLTSAHVTEVSLSEMAKARF